MADVYPSEARTVALVAEFIREELGGKFTLVGLYPGDNLVFPAATRLPVTLPLAVAFLFKDGHGQFDQTIRILSPGGVPTVTADLGRATKEAGRNHLSMVQLPAFSVT